MALIKKQTQPEFVEKPTKLTCAANGCRLRGTISSGGDFVCQYHYSSNHWPRMTEAMDENEHILLAIMQIQQYDDMSWSKPMKKNGLTQESGFEMMTRFMESYGLAPSEAEKKHYRWYERRLMDELLHRGGAGQKPVLREPLKQTGKRGNLSRYV